MAVFVKIIFILFLSTSLIAQDMEEPEDLIEACAKGNLKIVKQFLEKGAKVNARAESGKTPGRTAIMWAASRGKKDIVSLLIDHGAEINAKDNWKGNRTVPEGTDGWTPLIFAADSDHEQVVKVLIEKGADVNVKTKSGITALSLAQLWRNEEMIEILKGAGAKE